MAYCTGRPTERSTNKKESPCPNSPTPAKKIIFDCSNMACNEYTKDRTKWKKACHSQTIYYFCSVSCYNDWLADPSQLGSWSPPSSATHAENPTPLKI